VSRLGVVVNPTAGLGRGAANGRDVLGALGRAGHDVVDLSAATADEALAAARAARHHVDAVVVVGGDGMVHLGINAVEDSGVPLAVVPVGSGNDFARTVGLPVHDIGAALAVISGALERGPRAIDVLRADGADGTRRTGCVVSAGIDAAVNARANAYRWPPGGAKYVRGVLAEIGTFAPYGFRLTIDGEVSELDGTLVAVANGPCIGGGMRIAPHAVVDDGLADVVVAEGLGRAAVLGLFPKLYTGAHLDHPAVRVVRAREVVLEARPGHPAPPDAHGDGERIGRLPLRVTVEPGALQLLGPAVP
jgi:diacylglycerol kinase (ATP)